MFARGSQTQGIHVIVKQFREIIAVIGMVFYALSLRAFFEDFGANKQLDDRRLRTTMRWAVLAENKTPEGMHPREFQHVTLRS
jgi:hypothetical protein